MKNIVALLVYGSALLAFGIIDANAQPSAFTYQGQLSDTGFPANGSYDMQFALRDGAPIGNLVGTPVMVAPVGVTNGIFTVTLDFGGAPWNGSPRWLQIGVRTNGSSAAYTVLAPLQPIASTPYAIQASSATTVTGTVPASSLTGSLPNGLLSGAFSSPVTLSSPGNNLSGNGGGLTALNASQLTAGTVPAAALGNAWQLGGNVGANPTNGNFLGTADYLPLEFRVGGSRVLRLEPNLNGGPNVIAGAQVNVVADGIVGATIGGGGATNYFFDSFTNRIYSDFGTISGGAGITIQGYSIGATIGGGYQNTIQTGAEYTTIGGGYGNWIQGNTGHSVIGGGAINSVEINAYDSIIGGGDGNTIQAPSSTVGGGVGNTIQTNASFSFIGGGYLNTIQTGADGGTIGAGAGNTIQANSDHSTIGGGNTNIVGTASYASTVAGGVRNLVGAYSPNSSIGGGQNNQIQTNSDHSTIGGGGTNTIRYTSYSSTIGGGWQNILGPYAPFSTISGGYANTNSGQYATVPGGSENAAQGDYSFAAGRLAQAVHTGSFVWGDSTPQTIASTSSDQFTVRAAGGVRLFSNSGATAGVALAPGGTAWGVLSDRTAKKNFKPVDEAGVLDKLEKVPVMQWNYKWEPDNSVPHLGPVAQDFKAAFYPGRDDKSITTLEFDGVELAAIQALNRKLERTVSDKDAKIHSMEDRITALEQLVKTIAEKN